MIAWLLAGCATPMLLPTHHASELLEAPLGAVDPPSFVGNTILLRFEGDESVVPLGALLDDFHRDLTPATQSYVMSEPGRVLFESLAARLADAGAEVFRAYPEPAIRPDALADAETDPALVAGLNEIPGIRCATPVGAFYAFPSVSGTGLSGHDLAERLLHEAGVCVLSGTAFGGVGTDHVRISYANSRENLTEALGRIRAFVGGLGRG